MKGVWPRNQAPSYVSEFATELLDRGFDPEEIVLGERDGHIFVVGVLSLPFGEGMLEISQYVLREEPAEAIPHYVDHLLAKARWPW